MALYYVQDKRQYVGNSMLWWRPSGAGYTTDLSQAGQYDHKPSDRDTDVLWSVEYIESVAKLHIDFQDVDETRQVTSQQKPVVTKNPDEIDR